MRQVDHRVGPKDPARSSSPRAPSTARRHPGWTQMSPAGPPPGPAFRCPPSFGPRVRPTPVSVHVPDLGLLPRQNPRVHRGLRIARPESRFEGRGIPRSFKLLLRKSTECPIPSPDHDESWSHGPSPPQHHRQAGQRCPMIVPARQLDVSSSSACPPSRARSRSHHGLDRSGASSRSYLRIRCSSSVLWARSRR